MGALSPRAIAEMEPDLIALVDRLLDAIAAKGNVELIGDFAAAIPVEVIGNLLDVPRDEREPLRDWSLAILGALEPVISADVFARGNKAVKDFLSYLEILVERRRAKPGNPERDVLTRLIQGDGAGAARRRDRDLAIPGAVSELRAERSAAARRPRSVSRIFERAVRGRLGFGCFLGSPRRAADDILRLDIACAPLRPIRRTNKTL